MTEGEFRERLGYILRRDRSGTIEAFLAKLAIDTHGILDLFKEAGYVKLAKDQSLPELYPEVFAEGLRLPSAQELQRYKKAMEWLIHEAGWRKVEQEEE